jgi:alanine dehydrogenase
VTRLANLGWKQALRADPHLRAGLNIWNGRVTCAPVAQVQGYEYLTPEAALAD